MRRFGHQSHPRQPSQVLVPCWGTLDEAERAAGILGCSTGNHGQSLAYAAARYGVRCTIVVPEGNNPDKNRAIRRLGAELIEHGRDFDEAREYLECELAPRGGRYVHSANEPKLIAGVGTMAVEIFDDLPDPDVIFVPIGLGSGVCGTGIVTRSIRPTTEVMGVQAAGPVPWSNRGARATWSPQTKLPRGQKGWLPAHPRR